MRVLVAAVLLAAAFPAAAQLVKCVDKQGRTHYTADPEKDCPGSKIRAMAGKGAADAKPAPPQPDKAQSADCKKNRELLAWLDSPRGAKVENRPARMAQVKAALRDCP